jgi:thioredoxin-like negative regulator of GroEL
MNDLEPHDVMHLNAAEGWLGLENVIEADKELKQITPTMHRHPEVLGVRYEMFAKAECWPKCEEVAEAIVMLEPESTFGWIRRSFALHEQDLTATAREKLLPAVDLFPDDITIRYNLACYECVLGNMSEAKLHLAEAFNVAHNQNCTDEWKKQMLGDPDLKPLWGIWDEVEI